jgi:hypothetical protein
MTTLRLVALPALVGAIAFATPAAVPAAGEFPNVPGRANVTPSIGAAGTFVAVAWGASANGKADIFVAVSRDSGTTFGSAVQVNTVPGEARLNGEMPPRVALGSSTGSSLPAIVVLWTARGAATEIKAARSHDGGRTFGKPTPLQASGAAGDRGWPSLALDRSGRLHAIWLDHRGLAAARAASGGASGHKPGASHDGVAMARNSSLYHASLSGSSATEREVTKGVCYCCKTALAAGADGTLFAAWRHVYPGSFRDMAFATSRDGGRSFSAPVRVSEDGWAIDACPDDGPAMAVDASGTVHLAWPTVIGGDNPRGAIFYASTRDGRRFTKRQQVETLGGPKPSHPQIVVDSHRRVFVAWDELANGRQTAAVREVRADATGPTTFGRIVMLSSTESGIYPALAATGNRVLAAWATGGDRSRVRVSIRSLALEQATRQRRAPFFGR